MYITNIVVAVDFLVVVNVVLALIVVTDHIIFCYGQ